MEKGWSAKDLLLPLWRNYPGKRDGLAAAVGTSGSTLSAINRGRRNLGMDLGPRLAKELNVSLLQLGAPINLTDERGRSLIREVEDLRQQVGELQRMLLEIRQPRPDHPEATMP